MAVQCRAPIIPMSSLQLLLVLDVQKETISTILKEANLLLTLIITKFIKFIS